jgi:hypothetical protein
MSTISHVPNPALVSVKTGNYTIPEGYYARLVPIPNEDNDAHQFASGTNVTLTDRSISLNGVVFYRYSCSCTLDTGASPRYIYFPTRCKFIIRAQNASAAMQNIDASGSLADYVNLAGTETLERHGVAKSIQVTSGTRFHVYALFEDQAKEVWLKSGSVVSVSGGAKYILEEYWG